MYIYFCGYLKFLRLDLTNAFQLRSLKASVIMVFNNYECFII